MVSCYRLFTSLVFRVFVKGRGIRYTEEGGELKRKERRSSHHRASS
ncbi:hypothetical protein HMPREF9134_00333 [Porphyromonas catoniae F0037]|uniref:Uncharacterized protein n=1 Tax=Porphyromonas catoniae F0037 TaxID=1127696 RepID=L1NGT4_9PORP|nr:hypothetical protein HMPREF9134_00333 [Porphyromonas catoniae F0037]